MNKKIYIFFMVSCMLLLSGCLYPQSRLQQNQVPYQHQLDSVQAAVHSFQKDTGGLLPIKTRDMTTHVYQKYPIEFSRLVPKYLPEPPANAYEAGGVFVYVLVDVENTPTVKLLDIRLAEKISELNLRVDIYRQSNGYPPFKEVISDKVYALDYSKLGYKEPLQVISPYSGKGLPLVMNNEGKIFVDYRIDLYDALQSNQHAFKHGDDIRGILVDTTMFVPAYSLPYTVNDKNEPIFLIKKS
ncbi:hypothetical protein EJF36_11395 [Bacillus sp. HMF5848]|uniref:hypothetical protein n=1 Tax=Bacillus sp. HMF5848 TaxID=2495421 RepID=UPI000F7929F2|nr:hypothetical protein [Bacillus sp. HMF5848]RSK27441.1 hypothetical protein EJF36_11395 [Bacillus sp. HMF5848]